MKDYGVGEKISDRLGVIAGDLLKLSGSWRKLSFIPAVRHLCNSLEDMAVKIFNAAASVETMTNTLCKYEREKVFPPLQLDPKGPTLSS